MWAKTQRLATPAGAAGAFAGAPNKKLPRSERLWLTDGTGMKRTVSESLTARDSSFVPYKLLYLNRF
jgi:hypothetical protein